ncbi:hypothetical protein ABRY23_03520 [Melioribacteraceae bacterium 4301-Me]|uniref:hypothetical protein n=1 Tax=Pyranulibacter aquaticus TaxID=3163344 RepID=UPI003596393C
MKALGLKIILALLFFLSLTSNNYSQTFGFGCLGLSGVYGGIAQYNYKADGLNNSLKILNVGKISSDENLKFEQATGYRIGANIFRAKFTSVFFSAKGYFQFLKEEHSYSQSTVNGIEKNTYRLSLNHWGIGLDIGIPIITILDIKLLEGGITFFNPEFVSETSINGNTESNYKINTDKTKIGYYIGGGIILHLVPDYISVEGTAAYSFYQIDKMDNGTFAIPVSQVTNKFIEQGGFSAVVQLNIGFPL